MKNRELEIKKNWNKARKEEGGLEAVTKLTVEVKKNPAIGVDPYAAAIRYDNRDFKYDDDDDVVGSRQQKPKMLALPAPEKTNDPSSSSAINSSRKEQVSLSSSSRGGGLAWQFRTDTQSSNSNDKLFDSREDILNILD